LYQTLAVGAREARRAFEDFTTEYDARKKAEERAAAEKEAKEGLEELANEVVGGRESHASSTATDHLIALG
jgi:Sec-independent protein translocase protein TatA